MFRENFLGISSMDRYSESRNVKDLKLFGVDYLRLDNETFRRRDAIPDQ